MAEFLTAAADRADTRAGEFFEIPTLTMFCFAIARTVYDRIGPLDEGYGVGTLEDDDYSLRLARAGLELRCAEDVLVHHFGRASFGEMVSSGAYGDLLERNQDRFTRKWGRPWTPYRRRTGEAYRNMATRLRALVDAHVPAAATVLVVSKGDDALLDLGSRRGWHLPQSESGAYAGHYPEDSSEAIAQLESLRARGGEFVVFPRTSQWWLEHYEGLRRHLEGRYARVADESETGTIYALRGPSP